MAQFRGKQFEIPITRDVDPDGMEWPSNEDLLSDTVGGNRDFLPLGRTDWVEVQDAIDEERSVMDTIAASDDQEAAHREWREENAESDDPTLFGFDLGTNALSAALSAARCVPFYSCNGGAFDEGHHEEYPLIAFFCPVPIFPFVCDAAKNASIGLEYNDSGGLNVFARNVDSMVDMAVLLFERRREIDAAQGVPILPDEE
jgi:hypothetical protein